MLDLAAKNKIKPMINVISMKDVKSAIEAVQNSSVRYRTILMQVSRARSSFGNTPRADGLRSGHRHKVDGLKVRPGQSLTVLDSIRQSFARNETRYSSIECILVKVESYSRCYKAPRVLDSRCGGVAQLVKLLILSKPI